MKYDELVKKAIETIENNDDLFDEEDTYTFSVKLPKEDYAILDLYDFYFEKNISEYLQQIAYELKR